MKDLILGVAIFFLLYSKALGQGAVHGVITDSLGSPIKGVRIYALSVPDSLLVARSYSEEDGAFELELPYRGHFELTFQHMGYIQKAVDYRTTQFLGELPMLNIILFEQPIALSEVIVNAEKPIRMTKDTVHIRVANYLSGNERVAEDVIKRLPGLEVGDDGGIRVRGKAVSKVLIEGDNLFDSRYTLLTRNLNANLIEKVQVIYRYSENPLLKGIQDQHAIALNISLKDEVKQTWFGQTEVGLGLPELYGLRPNLIQVRKTFKAYLMGNLNNSGVPALGSLPGDSNAFASGEAPRLGDAEKLESFNTAGMWYSGPEGNRANFNKAQLGVGSFVLHPTKHLKIKGQSYYAQDDSRYIQWMEEIFKSKELQFINQEFRNSKFHFGAGSYNLKVQWLSENQQFEWESQGLQTMGNREDDLQFNLASLSQRQREIGVNLDNRWSYTLRLQKREAIQLTLRHKQAKSSLRTQLFDNILEDDDFGDNFFGSPQQNLENEFRFTGIEAAWFGKKEAITWNLFGALSQRKTNLNSLLSEPKGVLDYLPLTFDTQNQLTSDLLRGNTGLKLSVTHKKFVFHAGVRYQRLTNTLDDVDIQRFKFNSWIPEAGIDWKPNRSNFLLFNYSFSLNETGLPEWTTGLVLTDFRNFNAGGRWLAPFKSHNWLLVYNIGEWGNAFQFNTSWLCQWEPSYLGTVLETAPAYTIFENDEFSHRRRFTVNLQADQYLKSLDGNFKAKLQINQSEFTTQINQQVSPIQSRWIQVGPEWKTLFNGGVNFHAGYYWNVSRMFWEGYTTQTSQKGFFDVDFGFNARWNGAFTNEIHAIHSGSETSRFLFSDLSISVTSKSGRPVYRMELNNLWNIQTFGNTSLTDTGYMLSQKKLRPRTVLFTVEFKL